MKTKLFIFFTLFVVAFSSCKLEGESNYTPDIFFVHYPKIQGGDSLIIIHTGFAGVLAMDTISVGDTVLFYMLATGHMNNLSAFHIVQSADSSTSILYSNKASMDSIFSSGSDYKAGKFIMSSNSTTLYFPFKYVAEKANTSAKLTFTVVSDARFTDITTGSNTNTIQLNTPIRVKKDSIGN